jgi:hypothetical protein
LTLNQPVTGSSPVRLTTKLTTAADFPKSARNVAQSCKQPSNHPVNWQSKEFEVATLSEFLAAYRICAKILSIANNRSYAIYVVLFAEHP